VHDLLHTTFENRKRIKQEDFILGEATSESAITLDICFGTSCFLRGAQALYRDIMEYLRSNNLEGMIQFKATFCGKQCKKGPVLNVNGNVILHCTLENAISEINRALKR
jgi:NADH-quinone oxidoreductase subunit G